VLLTWIAKMEIASGGSISLVDAATIGRIPGQVVWAVVIAGYVAITAIGLLAQRSYPMGNEAAQAVLRQEPD
jgi:hypothetical protein